MYPVTDIPMSRKPQGWGLWFTWLLIHTRRLLELRFQWWSLHWSFCKGTIYPNSFFTLQIPWVTFLLIGNLPNKSYVWMQRPYLSHDHQRDKHWPKDKWMTQGSWIVYIRVKILFVPCLLMTPSTNTNSHSCKTSQRRKSRCYSSVWKKKRKHSINLYLVKNSTMKPCFQYWWLI